MKQKLVLRLGAIALVILLSSCELVTSVFGGGPVTGVSISPSSLTLTSSGSHPKFKAVIEPSNAGDKKVTWSSSDPSCISISSDGVLTFEGDTYIAEVTITVTTHDGQHQATATVYNDVPW